jgi:hypothetical protein
VAKPSSGILTIGLVLKQGDRVLGKSEQPFQSNMLEVPKGLPAGEYTILVPVQLFIFGPGTWTGSVYVHTWLFPSTAAAGSGTMQVSPSSVPARPDDFSCCPITLRFSNLDFISTMPKR